MPQPGIVIFDIKKIRNVKNDIEKKAAFCMRLVSSFDQADFGLIFLLFIR